MRGLITSAGSTQSEITHRGEIFDCLAGEKKFTSTKMGWDTLSATMPDTLEAQEVSA